MSITKVYPPPRHQGNSPILGDIIISSLSGFVGFGWENFSQPVSSLEVGVIARFVPEITLREDLANNWTAEHYARFLAGLRCNGRALVRSAAPEFQLKSPVRMMWSQPRGETCLSNFGSGSRPFRRR